MSNNDKQPINVLALVSVGYSDAEFSLQFNENLDIKIGDRIVMEPIGGDYHLGFRAYIIRKEEDGEKGTDIS